ncbi:MAG TPA: ABC transporter substrate-binding protein [Chloroflexota bacterium]|nr:ABC transporter substrate-binding protein [Chloroflexota bacterium]
MPARPTRRRALARSLVASLAGALILMTLLACAPAAQPSAAGPASAATSAPPAAVPAASSLAAQDAAPAPSAALQTVTIGVINTIADAPFYLADKRGYFREAGIQPEMQVFQSGALMIAPLSADQLDVVGGGALSAGLYNAVGRNINLHIVSGHYGEDGSIASVLRKDLVDSGRVKSVADFKGLKLQLAAECIEPEVSAAQYLATGGLTMNDVETVYMAFGDVPAAIANGSLDVANPPEPLPILMEGNGTGVILHRYETNRQLAVMLYSPAFSSRKELATGFMEAVLRGKRDYYNALFGDRRDRDEVIQIMIDTTPVKQRALYDQIVLPRVDPNGDLNRASMAEDQEYYLAKGCQPQRIDLARAIDTSFLDAALERLGRYQGGSP